MAGLRAVFGAALMLGASCTLAPADNYPAQAVRILIAANAGSPADLTARVLGRRLNQKFNQPFLTENRPGTGAEGAAAIVARAPKDGYTLLMGTAANTILNSVAVDPALNFTTDLAPIVLIASVPQILVVTPTLGVDNVRELIALAKAHPGELSFGSSGIGSATELSGELFNKMAEVRILRVPYSGISPAVTDLLAGRISAMFAPASAVLQYVDQGRLKALATTGGKRAAIAPTLPTMTEAGVPGFETGLWFGLLAPAGTPEEAIQRIGDAVNEALLAHEIRSALRVQGIDPVGGSPTDFARHIESETRKWSGIAATVGLKK
jgi:tripartite-type tricarboxylate transporter receptor subunit TctC